VIVVNLHNHLDVKGIIILIHERNHKWYFKVNINSLENNMPMLFGISEKFIHVNENL